MIKPANDNESAMRTGVTPAQAKKLMRLRELGLELANLATELQRELIDKPAAKKLFASIEPDAQMYAKVEAQMRKKGLR